MQIPERLYNLLPPLYRRRDTEQGQALRALLAIIDAERQRIEDDVAQLYDDQFIETCQPWAIPYIADLLGVRLPSMLGEADDTTTPRAYVANALGYRRRKGVLRTLEELTTSITGWPTVAVEFYKHLAVAQHVNHPRPERTGFARVRDTVRMLDNGGPFESVPRSAEVRLVESARGRYGVSNLGLFLWRTRAYTVTGVRPRPADAREPGVEMPAEAQPFHVHPLGKDLPLFNPTSGQGNASERTGELDVPAPLRTRRLYDELEARRDPAKTFEGPGYFGGDRPPFAIHILPREPEDAGPQPDPVELGPEDIYVCNLEVWRVSALPDADRPCALVDPERGRLVVLGAPPKSEVVVDYAYGSLADVGAGPYNRQAAVESWLHEDAAVDFQVGVGRRTDGTDDQVVATLQAALDRWKTWVEQNPGDPAETVQGVIAIMDDDTYAPADNQDAFDVPIPRGHRLAIVGATWGERNIGELVADEVRPHLAGGVRVVPAGIDALAERATGELVLDGLLVEGGVEATAGALGALSIFHCTLAPDHGGVDLSAEASTEAHVDLRIQKSIVGPVTGGETRVRASVGDSVVDAGGTAAAIAGAQLQLDVARSTVLGTTEVERLEASDCVFDGAVDVDRRQDGCVRFCWAPSGSRLPRVYRCQPHTALEAARAQNHTFTPNQERALQARLRPRFVSRRWWRAGYAQLDPNTAVELRTGADGGAEMGVYNHLRQPQRLANLAAALDEHLRVGMYAGIFFVT